MSLILDALNRAERERRNADNRVPDLQTIHIAAAEPAPQKKRTNMWFFLGPIILVVVIAALWFWQKNSTKLPAIVPTATAPGINPVAPTASPVTEENNPASVSAPVATEGAAARQKFEEPVAATPIAEAAPETETTPSTDTSPVTDTTAISEMATQEAATEAPVDELAALYATAEQPQPETAPTGPQSLYEPEQESITAPAITAQESTPAASTSLPPATPVQEEIRNYESLRNLPDIGDLPWSFRQEIPSINYARHNFEDGHASVLLNGRAWQTGSEIAPELKLEEIYTDGVILSFRQVRFKLRALNSWINM